jgi:hypothetical protein
MLFRGNRVAQPLAGCRAFHFHHLPPYSMEAVEPRENYL